MDPSVRQLMWAVQALAQPADVQPLLFPGFVPVADELALEFDDCRQAAECRAGGGWSPGQRAALAEVDRLLTDMSGAGRPDLWSGPDCLRHPPWAEVRRLALAALAAFGWPPDRPPAGRTVYVPG